MREGEERTNKRWLHDCVIDLASEWRRRTGGLSSRFFFAAFGIALRRVFEIFCGEFHTCAVDLEREKRTKEIV